jgi:hypothetical protein
MYGIFGATPAAQQLDINARTKVYTLNIQSATTNSSLTNVLVRDIDGSVNVRNLSTEGILFSAPEYPNAVFNATGSGKYSIDIKPKFDSINFKNYYELKPTSGSTGTQDIAIYHRFMVPMDFASWNTTNKSMEFWYSGGTSGTCSISIYDTVNTLDFSVTTAVTTSSTWVSIGMNPLSGTYTPGLPFTIKCIPLVAQGQEIRLGSITMKYNK